MQIGFLGRGATRQCKPNTNLFDAPVIRINQFACQAVLFPLNMDI